MAEHQPGRGGGTFTQFVGACAMAPTGIIGSPRALAGAIGPRARRRDRTRRRGRAVGRLLALDLTLIAATLPAPADAGTSANDVPAATYDRQVGCAAIFTAARERLHDTSLLRTMGEVIASARREAQASGAAIGRTGEAVHDDIEAKRRGILRRIDAAPPSSDALKTEEADLGRVAIDCALLHAMSGKARH